MPFTYTRTIRFQDTDAAGVVYFANVLALCHEAYEESLAASGLNLKSFFSNPAVAIPIVHASVDFYRPMFCGDRTVIQLKPQQLNESKFDTVYQIFPVSSEQVIAKAITKHVCIDSVNRTKTPLTQEIVQWLRQWSNEIDC
ncbi:acyl-CoA thioesterase [Microcoleus sp. FACHB-831]|uniref:acyl-CoA thioesterase n=1 Tax=Microcoleus sp. FACHB-831 TaxID=2692827 RepID=UPI0016820DD1|nr:thioesterase family protein [Microcoleus sp. FACHB-831]MBD1923136.1 acyl-CoA thioesterase [Microcoleus sp. FACHB-831]